MAAISSNGLYRTRTLFAVELHPSTVSDVLGGVKEQLNAHLLRYVDEFDGVLVAYSNVQILTKQPVIHPYFPYFHLDVRADVLLFKPSPGMNLVARVNHLGEDYISALALGVFNVTIPARAVMPELHFLREENKWIHKVTPQHQIHEHSYIVFRVEDVKDNGGFFQISGSMREPATGAADFLHPGVQLPEPPAGWPADPVASPREDEDGDVVMVTGGEGATPSGRGLAALAAATAAAAAANGKPAHAGKQKHGKEGKDGKGSKREHGASGEEAAKKRRKTDAGAVPAGGTTPGAVVTPAAAAAATPAAAATGPDAKKDKKDKSDKKKEKEEKKKEKEEKKKQKEEKKKGKTEPPVPAQSAPPQMGAATAAGAAPSTAGPAHTTGAMANGVAAPAATPQPAAGNGATPAAEASKKKDKKEKKEKKETSEKKEKEKSSKKEKEKTGKKDKKTASR